MLFFGFLSGSMVLVMWCGGLVTLLLEPSGWRVEKDQRMCCRLRREDLSFELDWQGEKSRWIWRSSKVGSYIEDGAELSTCTVAASLDVLTKILSKRIV